MSFHTVRPTCDALGLSLAAAVAAPKLATESSTPRSALHIRTSLQSSCPDAGEQINGMHTGPGPHIDATRLRKIISELHAKGPVQTLQMHQFEAVLRAG